MRSDEVAAGNRADTFGYRVRSRGRFYRRLRSVRYQCASDGAGLAVYFASAVTERSCIDSIKPVLVINPRIS
uniref:Uncharacterized protein n=1 Tax=Candidatus Nitrotoga fabula TaxID=2182327 RepID=A0A2X0QVC6_9PROT|nr:protein of unknown function [Candidatus Nitrotoga fabula]